MMRPIVIKVGGSLFDWPEVARELPVVLNQKRDASEALVLLAGGGAAADFVRTLDRTFALGDSRAHHLALRSLDLTAHALATLVPGLVVVDELEGALAEERADRVAERAVEGGSSVADRPPLVVDGAGRSSVGVEDRLRDLGEDAALIIRDRSAGAARDMSIVRIAGSSWTLVQEGAVSADELAQRCRRRG